ncbi:hypothetical protein, partial [Escherichia coli]|uniref:hypothetical protein n=1 Tax=Escherichia coli TaxID=562 RepID=UPI0021D359FF
MNGKIIALIGVVVVFGLMAIGSVSMYVDTHDRAVEFEGNIKKYYDASESQLSKYTLVIQEKVQVSDKYK